MRIFIIAIVCVAILSEVNGLFSINFCKKKKCTKNSDCGSGKTCLKIFPCNLCITLPKIPVKPTTKKTTTTPTTTPSTTPTTTPTTPTMPPNTCEPPIKGEHMTFFCPTGHKKNSLCIARCNSGYCISGLPFTQCKCKNEVCKFDRDVSNNCKVKIDKCKTNADCPTSQECGIRSCGKVCYQRPTLPPCKHTCDSSSQCPSGYTCTLRFSCRSCQKIISGCPRPCSPTTTCPAGQSCQKLPCGFGCGPSGQLPCKHLCSSSAECGAAQVCIAGPFSLCRSCQLSTVIGRTPTCPIPVPGLNIKTFCGTPCVTDSTCKNTEVCCSSSLCKKSTCQPKSDICSAKELKQCTTDAECIPSLEKCFIHEGGCRKCSTGFSCPKKLFSCADNSDCKIPFQQCLPDIDGCRTCISLRKPFPPTKCVSLNQCLSDMNCKSSQKCLLQFDGCKRCQ